jgi:hypothetical protein
VWIWTVAERLPAPSPVDTTLALLDDVGGVVRSSADLPFALSTDSVLVVNSVGDEIVVAVSGEGVGTYELCTAVTFYTEGDTAGGPSNDLRSPRGLVQSNVWPVDDRVLVADAEISHAGDVDALPFSVQQGHTYRAALLTGGHALVDPRLGLYAEGDPNLRGEAEGVDAEYDPAPAGMGWPPDAALQWYAPADGIWFVQVESTLQPDPAQDFYQLLVEDLGPQFLPEPGAARVTPAEVDGAWTAQVTGDARSGADTVVVALDLPASLAGHGTDVSVSAWLQARSVGGPGTVDLTIRDPATGYVLLQLSPDPLLAGDPVVLSYALAPYGFGADLTFKVDLVADGPDAPWFLTVLVEP